MDKALRYLSLAKKAGRVSVGAEDCRELLQRRKGSLIVLASDAGEAAVKALRLPTERQGIPLLEVPYSKLQLAYAIGRGSGVAVIAFSDKGLADAFSEAVKTGIQQEEHI